MFSNVWTRNTLFLSLDLNLDTQQPVHVHSCQSGWLASIIMVYGLDIRTLTE